MKKIYTTISYRWDKVSSEYVLDYSEHFCYNGKIAQLCGATAAQNNIQQQQSAFSQQLTQQAGQVFGNSSNVFNDLMSTFSPTVAAGPSQQGFSAAENANLQSSAITQTGQAYKNAKAATGDAISSEGGGNTDLPTGTTAGIDANLASSAANQTSSELSQINLANYQTGQQNYNTAVTGMENAPSVFSTAASTANAATNSQNGAASTANQIAQSNNSWVQSVTGALGGVAGAATTGGMSMLGGSGSSIGAGLGSGDQGQMSVDPTTSSSNELL